MPSFQTWIFRQLPLALPFFCDNALDDGRIRVFAPLARLTGTTSSHFLLVTSDFGGSAASLCGNVSLVDIGGGEIATWDVALLEGFVGKDVGVAHGILGIRWWGWRSVALLVGVDGRDVRCGVSVGLSGLFTVSDEVLEVLYRRHCVKIEGGGIVRQAIVRAPVSLGWKLAEIKVFLEVAEDNVDWPATTGCRRSVEVDRSEQAVMS